MATQNIYNAVLMFDGNKTAEEVTREIDMGTDIDTILNEGLIAPMDEVGKRFSEGDLFVPEMLKAAQAMKAGMEILKPLLSDGSSRPKGTIIIGTVNGDLHDIGKNLVSMMLEGGGFRVVDLGVDVEAETFVSAVKQHNADVVGLSALLTTTMPAMGTACKFIKEKCEGTGVIVGGAPVTEAFAKQINADGYSDDAPGAVELARKLVNARSKATT